MGRGIAGSCELIAGKSAATGERFAVMVARFARTGAKRDPTCASIDRIVARELHNRNCVRIVGRLEAIGAKCAATIVNCEGIDATCVETFATFGTTGAMPVGTKKRLNGKQGEKGNREDNGV